MSDDFKFSIPATIMKSDDGKYKIGGLASTEDIDKQAETIIQKGIDLTPVDEGKGFFNFNHSNKPEDIIGVVDGYHRNEKGLFVHGELFKGHERAEAIYSIMKGLQERKRGAMGFSVEGQILERDPKNPKIIKKCRIKNVALTMNPVNPNTYASLVKSMGGAEIEFDSTKQNILESETQTAENTEQAVFTASQVVEIVKKALAVGDGYTQAPSDLTGGDALATSSMAQDDEKKKEKKKKKLKKMEKSLYKSNMLTILNKMQVLYPDNTRSEIWEAIKDRISTKFEDLDQYLVLML